MAWWGSIVELSNTPDAPQIGGPKTLNERVRQIIMAHVLDWLYVVLAVFTHAYFLAIVYLFFFHGGSYRFLTVRLAEAFSEPYLGALGVYVLLKEIRKRKVQPASRHYGEIFVAFWQVLLVISVAVVWVVPGYYFDDVAQLIVADSLAVLVIYMASLIHKP